MNIVPTFAGSAIFGAVYEIAVRPNPARIQWNSYNGVNGRERVHLGSEGYGAECRFLATALSEAALWAYEDTFHTLLASGFVGPLVDTMGTTWPNSFLLEFEPTEAIKPYGEAVSRQYRAHFEILLPYAG